MAACEEVILQHLQTSTWGIAGTERVAICASFLPPLPAGSPDCQYNRSMPVHLAANDLVGGYGWRLVGGCFS